MNSNDSTANKPLDLKHLWECMVDRWFWITDQFGMPLELARRHIIPTRLHEDIIAWMRSLEHCARRLIFLEAVELLKNGFAPKTKRAERPRAARVETAAKKSKRDLSAEDSKDWRVSFAMAPKRKKGKRSRSAFADQPIIKGYARSGSVAARIEALRRAIKFHEAFAKRFAVRLARNQHLALRAFPKFKIPTVDPARFFFEPIDEAARRAQYDVALKAPRADSS